MKRHSLLGRGIVAEPPTGRRAPGSATTTSARRPRLPGRPGGDEIPLESRIILVADTFEAMTSDRPYRRAPGPGSRSSCCAQRGDAVRPGRGRRAVPRARPGRRD